MAVEVQTLKDSLRIDGVDDDKLLQQYLDTAENYIKNAVGEKDIKEFYQLPKVLSIYQTAVYALASAYYNNRSALGSVQAYTVDLTLDSIIAQLRGMYDTFMYQTEGSDEGN
ncbi:phage gp6-like head-tail connector protein [Pediococcus stilesii]|uniref:Phage gp6-like head-tail connector protein n=1 Tax=Pediococcus stilesii TaxID=331679 RepID=A0A5R9BSQ0_9LACO|nr:head-tail connector protein [Pediococcus stilesii]TLQ03645.1 phage gp6-like head-tail connector protein [Pediococcus stilesii]